MANSRTEKLKQIHALASTILKEKSFLDLVKFDRYNEAIRLAGMMRRTGKSFKEVLKDYKKLLQDAREIQKNRRELGKPVILKTAISLALDAKKNFKPKKSHNNRS